MAVLKIIAVVFLMMVSTAGVGSAYPYSYGSQSNPYNYGYQLDPYDYGYQLDPYDYGYQLGPKSLWDDLVKPVIIELLVEGSSKLIKLVSCI
ncbi:M14 family metallopeptidase [Methanosarcina horonobensis]|nr:hypothetical protein [Methanosarcina horonobensis]